MTMNNVPPTYGSTRDRSDIKDLIASVDLASLVESRSGQGRASGSSVLFSCPSPDHADHHPSFSVYLDRQGRQRWKCQSQCGRSGDALDLLEWLENCSKSEALRRLREYCGKSWEATPPVKKRDLPIERPLLYRIVDGLDQSEADKTYLDKYLAWRGWSAEIAQEFRLSVVTDRQGVQRIRHPYLAPSTNGDWVVTWYQDRGPTRSAPRWDSPKGSASYPYNLRSLERDNLRAVIVCEGPADTISAHLALEGVSGVACIGIAGANAWKSQWSVLLEGLLVIVVMDNDEAGERLVVSIKDSSPSGVIALKPIGKDLSAMLLSHGVEGVKSLLLRALDTPLNSAQSARTLSKTHEVIALLLAAFDGSEVLR